MNKHIIDIADQIYDKLMDNTQYKQFSSTKVSDQQIDDETGIITCKYEGIYIKIIIDKN